MNRIYSDIEDTKISFIDTHKVEKEVLTYRRGDIILVRAVMISTQDSKGSLPIAGITGPGETLFHWSIKNKEGKEIDDAVVKCIGFKLTRKEDCVVCSYWFRVHRKMFSAPPAEISLLSKEELLAMVKG